MKKLKLFLLFAMGAAGATMQAQIYNYGFAATQGTYSEITGGTVVYSDPTASEIVTLDNVAFYSGGQIQNEVATKMGFPIGFNFKFGGTTFTHFAISAQGFIYLGNNSFTIDATDVAGFTNGAAALDSEGGRFSAGNTNLFGFSRTTDNAADNQADASTEIRYELLGNVGSRILVVQFKNVLFRVDNPTPFNFQVRLYEGSNKAELVYGSFPTSSSWNQWAKAGMKGSAYGLSKMIVGSTGANWLTGLSHGVTGSLSIRNATVPSGTTHTFTPPAACTPPTDAATNLTLTPASNSVSGTFGTAPGGADKYLVAIGKDVGQITTAMKPINGVVYQAGQGIGTSQKLIAVQYSAGTSFTATGLDGSSNYKVVVFSANDICEGGPVYQMSIIAEATTKTFPGLPALTVSNVTDNSVTLTATATQNVIIAQNQGQWATDNNNNQLNDGYFGQVTSSMNVGDAIPNGGTVIYKGPAGAFTVNGLESNKLVNFAAWCYDASENTVSSQPTKANALTWGALPYSFYAPQFAPYESLFEAGLGWERDGSYFRLEAVNGRGSYMQCNVSSSIHDPSLVNSVTSQWIKLESGDNRFKIGGNLTITTTARPFVTTDYVDWDDKDSILIYVYREGYSTPTLAHTVCNARNNTFGGLYDTAFVLNAATYANKNVRIKVEWHAAQSTTLSITKFQVEQVPEYEYPVDLHLVEGSVSGSNATVEWTPVGPEQQWQVRWRENVTGAQWSSSQTVTAPTCQLKYLPTSSQVEVQVRGVISGSVFTPWTPSIIFNTGYGLPYSQNFNATNNLTTFTTNSGWATYSSLSSAITTNIRLMNNATTGSYALTLLFAANPLPMPAGGLTTFAILPTLDFGDGTTEYTLDFDFFVNGAVDVTDSIYVVTVNQNGAAYEPVEYLAGYNIANPGHKTIELTGFSGSKRLAFMSMEHVRHSGTTIYFQVDNLVIESSCPSAVESTEVSDVTTSSAKVSWTGTETTYQVFIRKAGVTTRTYETVNGNEKTFTGLDRGTEYEVGITNVCTGNDYAPDKMLAFATLSAEVCLPVTNVVAEPGYTDLKLSWTSDAPSFKVRLRKAGETAWLEQPVSATTFTFTSLTHNSDYEYSIQAVCGSAAADVSEWTPVATAHTQKITCAVPTNVKVTPGHKTALVEWEGSADKYELNYRLSSASTWTIITVSAKSCTIEGLTPLTSYNYRLRSICDVGDSSMWTNNALFTTASIPVCVAPTALAASSITATSVSLAWTPDAANLKWDLRYRLGGGSTDPWKNVQNLTNTSYNLTDLQPLTAYLWSVRSHCDDDQVSSWATQSEFQTANSGIGSAQVANLKVTVVNGVLNVLNPQQTLIQSIQLFDSKGALIRDIVINATDNVLMTIPTKSSVSLVKITAQNSSQVFKVLNK